MNTIIEKIRAEVERLKRICTAQIKANPGQTFPFVMEMTGYDKLLAKLSDFEKECQWSAEDETKTAYICDVMSGKELVSDISPSYRSEIIEFAKSLRPAKVKSEKPKKGLHSGSLRKVDNPMKWMEEDSKKPTTAEGLEEEFRKYWDEMPPETILDREAFANTARHFANIGWNKGYIKGREDAHKPAREVGLPKRFDKQPVCEGLEEDIEKFIEKMDAWKARFSRPDDIPVKATMAFTARMFYMYPKVARKWYESLPKATQD